MKSFGVSPVHGSGLVVGWQILPEDEGRVKPTLTEEGANLVVVVERMEGNFGYLTYEQQMI